MRTQMHTTIATNSAWSLLGLGETVAVVETMMAAGDVWCPWAELVVWMGCGVVLPPPGVLGVLPLVELLAPLCSGVVVCTKTLLVVAGRDGVVDDSGASTRTATSIAYATTTRVLMLSPFDVCPGHCPTCTCQR